MSSVAYVLLFITAGFLLMIIFDNLGQIIEFIKEIAVPVLIIIIAIVFVYICYTIATKK